MRKVILQLFIDKNEIVNEINALTSVNVFPSKEAGDINRTLVTYKQLEVRKNRKDNRFVFP